MQPSPTLYLALGLVLEIYWLVIRDQLELRLMRVFLMKNKTKQNKQNMTWKQVTPYKWCHSPNYITKVLWFEILHCSVRLPLSPKNKQLGHNFWAVNTQWYFWIGELNTHSSPVGGSWCWWQWPDICSSRVHRPSSLSHWSIWWGRAGECSALTRCTGMGSGAPPAGNRQNKLVPANHDKSFS